jgi:glycosyltransferase involved in cell wall biosynthesis
MDIAPPAMPPVVTIVVPARNEEACLADCLQSLIAQAGIAHEIIVVDDGSTDRTREIALSFPGVRVITPPVLPADWTGKTNAVVAGAREARGQWILFTDADTVHIPGSLARAVAEAKEHEAVLLSYSPEQIAVTFWEMAVLPVVFAELARQYPPKKVSDPASPIAAANGQYVLVQREAYEALGGHAAVAESLLEDVALARAFKSSGRKIRFRYAADAVRTRMYRNFSQLREGWTKNLALLFPNPGRLALRILLEWGVPWLFLLWPVLTMMGAVLMRQLGASPQAQMQMIATGNPIRDWWWTAVVVVGLTLLTSRLRRANFGRKMGILGTAFGYPTFAYLLLRSKRAYSAGRVSWKGRDYRPNGSKPSDPNARNATCMLRTEN